MLPLRNRMRAWVHRPSGRFALALLVVALLAAGVPTGIVHSHDGGDVGHDHASMNLVEFGTVADHPGHDYSGQHPDAADSEIGAVLHLHAQVASVTMLAAAAPAVRLSVPLVLRLQLDRSDPPPASATHRPLYRPPIANA